MPQSQLTSTVVHRFPIAVVRLQGQLTTADVSPSRAALVELLVEEPTSVVVDMAGLTVADDAAMALFPAVAELSARWPGAHLLMCGASAQVAQALQHVDGAGTVSLYDTCGEAIAVAAKDPVPRRLHQYLEPTAQAPRAARELAAHACWEWDLAEVATTAQVVASELVTNAVRHARTTVSFSVTLWGAQLRLSVRDWSSEPVRLRTPGESDEQGRGLLVVDTVASGWGHVSLGEGKVVWATLPVAPRAPATRS